MADAEFEDLDALKRLVGALAQWNDRLLIAGGWAHRLYRLVPTVQSPRHQPIRTRDADVVFAADAVITGDMGAALRAAGFHEEFSGEHQPPVTWYTLGGDTSGFYAEFLAPLTGSGVRRNGASDATMAKGGVTAQKLRHLDLLLIHPWTIRVSAGSQVAWDVRVPNPVCFMVQKLLIHNERPSAKRAQDLLYVHDTLELFGNDLPNLKMTWREHVEPILTVKQQQALQKILTEQFGAVTDVHRAASRIPQDRQLLPTRVQQLCQHGLKTMMG